MKKNAFWVLVLVIMISAIAVLVFKSGSGAGSELTAFTQCLAEENIVMYGARSCSWCQKEKVNFGNAFEYVPYVDCSDEPQKCIAAGIQYTPTWVFPDGKELIGYQGLEKLSLESGCPLRPEQSEASPLP